MHSPFSRARSLLFVPGDRPERFEKAQSSGADVTVFDLEDAVAPGAKDTARSHILDHLARVSGVAAAVRISAPTTADGQADLDALGAIPPGVAVMVAKADRESLTEARGRLGEETPLLPLVESARGIRDAYELAEAPGVVRLLFGHLDFSAELGIDPDDQDYLVPARFALRAASATANLAPPVDGVTPDFRDPELLRRDTLASLRAGFAGKLCIHPAQVPIIHEALLPSSDEVEWARRVLAGSTAEGVSVIDGAMVDRPVILRAESIMRRNGEFS